MEVSYQGIVVILGNSNVGAKNNGKCIAFDDKTSFP